MKNSNLTFKSVISRATRASLVLTMLGLSHSALADVTRGPYLQNATTNSMVVQWRSSQAAQGKIQYGTEINNLNQEAQESGSTTKHEVKISGLAPNTKYYYRVVNGSTVETPANQSVQYFTTNPNSAKNTRIWILGDSGTGTTNQRTVRDKFYQLESNENKNADVILALGDNAYNDGTDSEYGSKFFGIYQDAFKRAPVWSTQGNHERNYSTYAELFSHPTQGEGGGVASGSELYYSFDYGDIHFVCLDSYSSAIDIKPGAPQYQWLEQDLAATNKKWIIGFWHHPSYSNAGHKSDSETGMYELRENAVKILENYGVDMVFSGHNHSYHRSYFLNGHYGKSNTFNAAQHVVQSGDGTSTPYQKNSAKGAVYVMSGSAGKVGYNIDSHPANVTRFFELGSFVVDIDGDTLRGRFLRETGVVDDEFTISKASAGNVAPTAGFNFSVSDLSVSFVDNSSDADGSIASWSWNFGDGSQSTQSSPSHNYANAGTYSVTLTVTDNQGASDSLTRSVTVTNTPTNQDPVANFTSTSNNLTVSFTDQSNDPDGSIVSRLWNFGDGNQSSQTSPIHTYASAGAYNVSLTVTDNQGATATVSKNVTVSNTVPVAMQKGVAITNLQAVKDVQSFFTLDVPAGASNLTFDTSGGSGDADLYVRFGAAPSRATYDCRSWQNTNLENCTIASPQAGTYYVLLDAANAFSGVSLIGDYAVVVNNQDPVADFNFTASGLNVSFSNLSQDPDGSIASHAWDFGDSATSSAASPQHTYATAGTYNVSLTVTDDLGATNSAFKTVTVEDNSTGNELQNGVAKTNLEAVKDEQLNFTLQVPEGASNLSFAMSGGSGDADLYVSFGQAPTKSTYECRPYKTGNAENCSFATPQSGTYYVMIDGYTAFSGVTLVASFVESSGQVLLSDDFESGFGNWTNVTSGDTDQWTRDSGGTPSSSTGPKVGQGGSSYYLFLETSSCCAYNSGDTAFLQSPVISGANRTLTFWYHMYGSNIGALHVDVEVNGVWQNSIWSISGQQQSSQSNDYIAASVSLAQYSGDIRLRFRAVAAGGWKGDMAIDSIQVLSAD